MENKSRFTIADARRESKNHCWTLIFGFCEATDMLGTLAVMANPHLGLDEYSQHAVEMSDSIFSGLLWGDVPLSGKSLWLS